MIRKFRLENNLAQSELAPQLGMSQSAYSRLEQNPEKATVKILRKLGEIYSVDPSVFVIVDKN